MIHKQWNKLQNKFHIKLDEYIVMPNHFHGILIINNKTKSAITIGAIIGAFKSITTRAYIDGVKKNNWQLFDQALWQRNYYEHTIRDNRSLEEIQKYIITNPYNWKPQKQSFP